MSIFRLLFYLVSVCILIDDSIRGLRRINKDTKHRKLSIAWHVAGLLFAIVGGATLILEALGIIGW